MENLFGSSYLEIEKPAEAAAKSLEHATAYNGGIEDDDDGEPARDEGGVLATIQELVNMGRSGGANTVKGNFHSLLSLVRKDVNYSLIVVGDLFLSKTHETRARLRRELGGYLGDRLNIPVISSEELQQKYLVGKKQFFTLSAYAAAVALVYYLVFHFQEPILTFFGSTEGFQNKILRLIVIIIVVPAVAFLYGTFAGLFLKFLKFE